MTADWSPATVEAAIHGCSQRIAKGVLICDKAYREFLKADHDYDLAFAKAYLRLDGTPAHERKYQAEVDTMTEREDRDIKEASYKLADRNMKAIQSELDALRSIGTSVRQAYSVAGRGEA